jgi:hypothetical protein
MWKAAGLYDKMTGTFIGYGDDSSPTDPGSVAIRDPFLGTVAFTQAGTYYIAVSAFPNVPVVAQQVGPSAITALTRPDGAASGAGGFAISGAPQGISSFRNNGPQIGSPYTLNISLSNPAGAAVNPVPEPSEWLAMGMAGTSVMGLMIRARSRRRKSIKSNGTVTAA